MAAALVAQDAEELRLPHPGRVLDASGQPVAGATVTFVASGSDGVGLEPDCVRTTTRDNGRFRIDLLPTRPYRVYAVAPAGKVAEGRACATPVVVRGTPMTELVFAAEPAPAIDRIDVRGLEPWRKLGEIRIETRVLGCPGTVPDAVMADADYVEVPLMADVVREVHVFVAGWHVFGRRGTGHVDVPPPQQLRGVVRDAAGKPVAGARVERVWTTWLDTDSPFPVPPLVRRFAVGESGADGAVAWWLAAQKSPWDGGANWPPLVFVAGHAGASEAVAAFTETVLCNERLLDEDAVAARELSFELGAADALQVRVAGARASSRFAWRGAHRLRARKERNSTTSASDACASQPLADGTASLLRPATTLAKPRLVLTGVVPRLAPDDPFGRSLVPRPLELGVPDARGVVVVEAADIVPLRLQVLDATGGPAPATAAACVSLDGGIGDPAVWPAETDSAGRLVLPVRPGRWLLLLVRDGLWCMRDLTVARDAPPQTLQLERMPHMRLRVVDPDGKPLAGARLSSSGASWGGIADPLRDAMQVLGHAFTQWSLRGATSDAEGRVEVAMMPADGLEVRYRISHAGFASRIGTMVADEQWQAVMLDRK